MNATTNGRLGLLVTLLAGTVGCATWQNATANPVAALASGPTSARVQQASGGPAILLRDPAIEGDSLVGWIGTDAGTARHATSLNDIRRLDVPVPHYAAAGAAGVVIGAGSVLGLVALLLNLGPSGT